jgi:tetratricopeptide (TPR) repeat protein
MLSATVAFETMLEGCDRLRAVELARFALTGDRLWTVDSGLLWATAAVVRVMADDDLGGLWIRSRAAAYARGSVLHVHSTNLWEGFWHWRRGELDEALACFRFAGDQARLWGNEALGSARTRAFSIGCHLDRGDLAAARSLAESAPAGPLTGEGSRLLRHAVARLLAAEGRHQEALRAVDQIPAAVPIPNPVWHPWRSTKALALHGLGRTPEAITLMTDEVELLQRWGAPSYLGASLRLLGRLQGAAGVDHLREAVELLSGTTAAVDLARARCTLGASPRVADDEAVPLLREAREAAHELGAEGVLRRACAALEARGVHDARPESEPRRSGLERQVLALAAAGLGVPEIAQRLFLTPGTVAATLETDGDGRLKFLSSPPTEAVGPDGSGVL